MLTHVRYILIYLLIALYYLFVEESNKKMFLFDMICAAAVLNGINVLQWRLKEFVDINENAKNICAIVQARKCSFNRGRNVCSTQETRHITDN